MAKILNNQEFSNSVQMGSKTAAIHIATGSAKLQCLADTESGNWVDVPDSSVTASTVVTFYCSRGLKYRWVLTGDAKGEMSL